MKTENEQAVIEAARRCFGMTTTDTETGETWLHGGFCTWNQADLVDAIRRLDGYPPYGKRIDPRYVKAATT